MTVAFFCYRDPFVRGWRIVFLMPMLFMPSAVAFIWKLAFNDGRVISDLLMSVGLASNNVDWLSSVWLARLTLIVADVWQWTPFLFIIFVGALQGQDEEIEEAARLDGASWSSIFWNISLPMMRPIIVVAVTLRGIDITTMFTNVYIMTQGTPGGATETMSYFIYRQGFRMFNFGYASAASVLMLLITIVIAQTIVRRAFKSGKS
ncbi:putative permease component of ABC transporter (plasmid) [Sinorhizobium fredii NGR234]|uniref:Permease component of ABC transporter n=2 Tax=Rhizobium fredii TaxID=380 RepID=C3KLV5_SINFN|nr:putative permease component of ABC transporter [Sinorhizobium fredii NGR234]